MTTPGTRAIPSVDRLLATDFFRTLENEAGRSTAVRIARLAAEAMRSLHEKPLDDLPMTDRVLDAAREIRKREMLGGVRRVINATGVIIHTNLGRSAISDTVVQAAVKQAARYCTLEFDLESGERGKRGARAEALLAEITGAEACVTVNNCAAAALLVLAALARGKEVIVSRGELVEIGGDFRVPDVLRESGAEMREIGTTNRTKLADYEAAINENTGMILRVHPSNFKIVGFTAAPGDKELSALAHGHSLPFFYDAGSGCVADLGFEPLSDEPVVASLIEAGADIVAFSGDKLFGSFQAGIVVGKAQYVNAIRKHPLYRALRADKFTYAAIEATAGLLLRGEFNEIPTIAMLSATPEEIRQRAESLAAELRGLSATVELIEGTSVIGGGSAPDERLPTWLVAIAPKDLTVEAAVAKLREGEPPVIARVQKDRIVVDLRTVFADEMNDLSAALRSVCE